MVITGFGVSWGELSKSSGDQGVGFKFLFFNS
jgi:hypothetical protein